MTKVKYDIKSIEREYFQLLQRHFFSITFSLRRVILKFKSIENREFRQLLLHRLATSKHSAMLFLEQ